MSFYINVSMEPGAVFILVGQTTSCVEMY